MKVLNDTYYKKFVMSAMVAFNKICDENNFIKTEEFRYSVMLKRLEMEINSRMQEVKRKMKDADIDQ